MIDLSTWKKAWALLDSSERRKAGIVLGIVVVGALSSALMVGSVLPFLSVLSDPERIQTVPILARTFAFFEFESEYSFLVALGLATLAMIVFTSAIQIFKIWAVARFSTMRTHTISHRLMAAYLRQPYEFFLDRHSGEMGTRILAESQQVVSQFLRPAAEAIAAFFSVACIVGLLLWVEPLIALIAFGVIGAVYGTIYALVRKLLRRLGHIRVDANSARFRIANEALGGVKDIKLLGREGSYLERYTVPSRRMARTQVTAQVISATPQFALQAVAFGGIVLLCLALIDPDGLATGAALGEILPILGLFAFAGQRLMPELAKLYQSFSKLQVGAAAVDTVHRDLVDRAAGGELPRVMPAGLGLRDRLQLETVSYNYPNAEIGGIRDISLDIRAGEKIGIVGGTGAGKTTLADLILGLLSPTQGRLLVDVAPITETNLRAWQQSVGYVPQDIFLTDASVTENIALGVPPHEIDRSRVERAARIARLDSFIQAELPEGYDTAIGERGVRLSGGQRQRIGIARALYHDANLIVFDEATSALDNLTEREVMASIDALPEGKTVVMIAHRLTTVQRCDRIVVMEKGRIVGCGSWERLMADSPVFQRIAQVSAAE